MSMPVNQTLFDRALQEHRDRHRETRGSVAGSRANRDRDDARRSCGNKVMWCGNGGSAADSQHLAAELVGRFRARAAGAGQSIALTTTPLFLLRLATITVTRRSSAGRSRRTALREMFWSASRLSGNSQNVCLALGRRPQNGRLYGGVYGGGRRSDGGRGRWQWLSIPVQRHGRIQEGHILCGPCLCD